MTLRILICAVVHFAMPMIAKAQVTIGVIPKREVRTASKPEPYDSLRQNMLISVGHSVYLPPISNEVYYRDQSSEKPFLFRLTPSLMAYNHPKGGMETEKRRIFTHVYKPLHYDNYREQVLVTNDSSIGNRYYTIVDVLYDEKSDSVWNLMMNSVDGRRKSPNGCIVDDRPFSQFQRSKMTDRNQRALVVMVDNENQDTVLRNGGGNFILVPYFVKVKSLYEGQRFVALNPNGSKLEKDETTGQLFTLPHLSIWDCKVDLIEKRNFKLCLILSNDSGQVILESSIDDFSKNFMLEEEYIQKQIEDNMQKQELEAMRNSARELRKIEEQKIKEARLLYLNSEFGRERAGLIIEGKIEIGMTMEMCAESWGNPMWRNRITTKGVVFDVWRYFGDRRLFFSNNVLQLIEE